MCILHLQPYSVLQGVSIVLPATWNQGVLGGSELGALGLSFPICEVRMILPVLQPSQGCFQGLTKSSALSIPISRALILRNAKAESQNGGLCSIFACRESVFPTPRIATSVCVPLCGNQKSKSEANLNGRPWPRVPPATPLHWLLW